MYATTSKHIQVSAHKMRDNDKHGDQSRNNSVNYHKPQEDNVRISQYSRLSALNLRWGQTASLSVKRRQDLDQSKKA